MPPSNDYARTAISLFSIARILYYYHRRRRHYYYYIVTEIYVLCVPSRFSFCRDYVLISRPFRDIVTHIIQDTISVTRVVTVSARRFGLLDRKPGKTTRKQTPRPQRQRRFQSSERMRLCPGNRTHRSVCRFVFTHHSIRYTHDNDRRLYFVSVRTNVSTDPRRQLNIDGSRIRVGTSSLWKEQCINTYSIPFMRGSPRSV